MGEGSPFLSLLEPPRTPIGYPLPSHKVKIDPSATTLPSLASGKSTGSLPTSQFPLDLTMAVSYT